ncbi:5-formyltetrahydrofolate cyclo-ligase [Lachnospiraceae bacterium 46-61]
MYKKTIRRNILKARNTFSEQEITQKSVTMWENLMQTDIYKEADIIFTYVSAHKEAKTTPFFNKIWNDGKKIAVPIIEENRNMDFVYLSNIAELTESKWGIAEPKKETSTIALPTEKSLFIVPALAIDKKGNRIGYGRGYYDTYFSKVDCGFKIGFLFSEQQIEEIEMLQNTDVALDGFVTEKTVTILL